MELVFNSPVIPPILHLVDLGLFWISFWERH